MSGKGRFMKKGQEKGKFQPKDGNSNATNTTKHKQFITDCNCYLGSARHASDYETTTEFLISHIKTLYDYGNDIGTALEKLEAVDTSVWKPRMQVSYDEDEEVRANENELFKIGFKSDYDTYRSNTGFQVP